jgi:nitrous oxide reductase
MSENEENKGLSRRGFLGGIGLSAGAAASAMIEAPARAEAAAAPNQLKRKAGYQETEHVRRVYELSRF